MTRREQREGSLRFLGPLLGFVTFVGGTLLTVLGMISWEPEADAAAWQVAGLALKIGLPLWGTFALLAFLVARRGRRVGAFGYLAITVGWLLPGVPALVAGVALAINAKLDHGAAEIRVVHVLGKEVEIARRSRTRIPILRLEPWRTGHRDPERLRVSEAQYAQAREGQRVRIRLRPGRLGWRWWEGWELEP
jgi:hypothetical protein